VIQKGARADDAFDDDKYLAAAVETGPIRICWDRPVRRRPHREPPYVSRSPRDFFHAYDVEQADNRSDARPAHEQSKT